MARPFKTFIFFFLILVFLLTVPAVVFYSQGYRFDFDQKRISKTGGLFIKAEPKKATIELNGKKIKETDLFFGSSLIENVFPGEHEVQVSKGGYLSWKKKLQVKESKVTDVKEIKLVRDDIAFKELSTQVKSIFIAPNLEQALLWEEDGSLKLYNFKTQVKSQILSRTDLPPGSLAEVLGADFSQDNSKILLKVSGREQLNFFLVESSLPSKPKRLSFIRPETQDVFFNRIDSQKALVVVGSSLFNADLARGVVDKEPFLKNITAFTLKDEFLYGLDTRGQLISYSFSTNASKILPARRLDLAKGEVQRFLEIQGPSLFFWQEGICYHLNLKKSESWQKLGEDTRAFALSPDSKKIAFSKEHELWLLFLEEVFVEPSRKKGEMVFISRLSKPINKIIWPNNSYLLLEAQGQLLVTELDNRDRAQLWPIGDFKNPEIVFDQDSQVLYLKQNSSFSVSSPIF